MTVPRLHIITDSSVLEAPAFPSTAKAVLNAGGSRIALHLRAPGTGGRVLWRVVEACAAVARESGSRIVINDRLDLAVGSGAWGVQLGRRSFPVAAARLILSSGVRIGVSVHDPEEARTAVDAGADFLIAGTLYPSLSHPGAGSTGVQWISAIPGRKPVIGVGGITPERVPEVLTAGAHGVAVIRGVWSSPSPVDAMEEYLAALPG